MQDVPAPTGRGPNVQAKQRARVFGRSRGMTERPATMDELYVLAHISPDYISVHSNLADNTPCILHPLPPDGAICVIMRASVSIDVPEAAGPDWTNVWLYIGNATFPITEILGHWCLYNAAADVDGKLNPDIVLKRPVALKEGDYLVALVDGTTGFGDVAYRFVFVED